jgi:trimeric autotransporter adhesin
MKKLLLLLLISILLFCTKSQAQLSLVKDILSGYFPLGSDPGNFINVNGTVFFTATDDISGTELWKTDGTLGGTDMVKDIKPGSESSKPRSFIVYHNILYFQAGDGINGTEFWRSDGTETGTYMVKDIYTSTYAGYGDYYSSSPQNFVIFHDTLFFSATDTLGCELWKSDGTASVTKLVIDLKKGSSYYNNSNPANLTVMNNMLYFSATDGVKGIELYKSDGTKAGTQLLYDINPDTSSSKPSSFVAIGNILYFTANDGTHGTELWKTDGTVSGTTLVLDINTGAISSIISGMTNVNGTLFFSTDNGSDGEELWKSDGTSAGTMMVYDIATGSSSSYPSSLISFKNKLYFTANDQADGFELWVSDGTPSGTFMLKDILSGSQSSSPGLYTFMNNNLYFQAQTSAGVELWKTDGTAGGTVFVKDIMTGSNSSSPKYFAAANGLLYFNADNGINGTEPWKSNGTAAGTSMISDIRRSPKSSNPVELVNFNNSLFFVADNSTTTNQNLELWKSDGTAAGTAMLKDLLIGGSSNPKHLTTVNNTLFFAADDGLNGIELWKTDGTSGGTSRVKDITNDFYSSDPDSFINVNGKLFFIANDNIHGIELWKSDGTLLGTVMVKDIWPGAGSSKPSKLKNVNGVLYFRANDSISGVELWKSDGTAAGTVRVKDINTGKASSRPDYFASIGNTLYFSATDTTSGTELWKSDGTEAGTVLVKDLYPGKYYGYYLNSSNPSYIITVGNVVFFAATTGAKGTELYKSDGTDIGTVMVKDIDPRVVSGYGYSGFPTDLINANGTLFFQACDYGTINGYELWKSDGTDAGTYMVTNINPGAGSSKPHNMTVANNVLFFVANDGTHGNELWKIDLNSCGTPVMVGEILPGKTGDGPKLLTAINNTLYFSAQDTATGVELWKYVNQFTFADTAILSYTICQGDSVLMNNRYYKTTGVIRDSLKTVMGCDSLVLMNLTVNPTFYKNTNVQKCIGDSVLIQGVYQKVSGTYTDKKKSIKGCDSIIDVTLSFSAKPPKPTITKEGTATMVSSATTGNQWYDDSGPIAGQTGQKYASTKNQKFYVIVTIDGCSSEPSNSFNPMIGSIINNNLSDIDIYPNPVSDKLTIEFSDNPKGTYTFYINNMEGREVMSGKITEPKNEIDVSIIPKGIYVVKIIYENKIGLIKIIKD